MPDVTLLPWWACMSAKLLQSRLTLWDPMDCSLQAPLSMGIFQARILGWVAMPFSSGSSQPRDRTQVSCITGGFFTVWVTIEVSQFPSPQLSNTLLSKNWLPETVTVMEEHPSYNEWQLSFITSPSQRSFSHFTKAVLCINISRSF